MSAARAGDPCTTVAIAEAAVVCAMNLRRLTRVASVVCLFMGLVAVPRGLLSRDHSVERWKLKVESAQLDGNASGVKLISRSTNQ